MRVRLFQPWFRLVVKQKLQTCEILTGCEQENRWNWSNLILVLFMNVEIGIWNYPLLLRFNVTGAQGEILYWAKENSSCCDRFWCGNVRYFQSWYSFRSFGNAGNLTMQSDHAQYELYLVFSSRSYTHALQGLWHDHHRPNNQRGYATFQTAHLPSKIFYNS